MKRYEEDITPAKLIFGFAIVVAGIVALTFFTGCDQIFEVQTMNVYVSAPIDSLSLPPFVPVAQDTVIHELAIVP